MLRYDPVRVVLVTAGLALAGAAFGGFAGAIALATVMVLTGDLAHLSELLALEIAGEVGAMLGLISAPVVVWVLLRRVPLGRVFLWLTPSAALGGVFGWFAFSSLDVIFGPTIAAFVGFITSAVALSIRYERAHADALCRRLWLGFRAGRRHYARVSGLCPVMATRAPAAWKSSAVARPMID